MTLAPSAIIVATWWAYFAGSGILNGRELSCLMCSFREMIVFAIPQNAGQDNTTVGIAIRILHDEMSTLSPIIVIVTTLWQALAECRTSITSQTIPIVFSKGPLWDGNERKPGQTSARK